MFPSLRQRLIIAAALAIGTLGWLSVRGMLTPMDGSRGLSLLSAHVGVIPAIGLVVLAAIPALLAGTVAGATGNPLSGAFAFSASLTVLGGTGGSIQGWMWRSNLPGGYAALIVEGIIWQAGLIGAFLVMQRLSKALRGRWPALASAEHAGGDMRLGLPTAQSLGAGLVCAVVAGIIACLLLPNGRVGQVLGALGVAFTLGGLAGQLVFPSANPIGLLASPCVVAIGGYLYVLVNFHANDAVLAAWYRQGVPGIALVLPIYYASAAVAGVAGGIGIAQALDASKLHPLEA